MRTRARPNTHTHTNAHVHTHTHGQTRAHTHTHTHTHVYTTLWSACGVAREKASHLSSLRLITALKKSIFFWRIFLQLLDQQNRNTQCLKPTQVWGRGCPMGRTSPRTTRPQRSSRGSFFPPFSGPQPLCLCVFFSFWDGETDGSMYSFLKDNCKLSIDAPACIYLYE